MKQAGRLEKLYADYREKAYFVVVYIREAHASDGAAPLRRGPQITQPKTFEERQRVAKECAGAVKFTMPMVIDGLDDKTAHAYGGFPDRLYVIGKDGRVAYQGGPGPFGFRPDDVEKALMEVLETGGVRRAWRF